MIPVARPLGWPTLAPAARYGIVGELVSALEPHTEADAAGLLITLLAMSGNAIDTGPHIVVSGQRHWLRLNHVLVGKTGGGRKGTAAGSIRPLFERAAPDWAAERCQSGLASGEGLISAVRDGSGDDPGVTDKRLYVTEQEFGRTLKASGREGSILSFVIREAWDSDKLANLTKKEPQRSTMPHVSICGHITIEELSAILHKNDVWNGHANRHLWVLVNRSQLLPSGGGLSDDDYNRLGDKLGNCIARAKKIRRMRRTREAETVWSALYCTLAELRPVSGPVKAVTDRAEAQLLRLSMIFAALDGSNEIDVEHLEAAWACLWYCEQSAAVIFGEQSRSEQGDRIVNALRTQWEKERAGLDRTQLHRLFGGNVTATNLDAMLDDLKADGTIEEIVTETGKAGRPRQTYWLTNDELNESMNQTPTLEPYYCVSSFLSYNANGSGEHQRARAAAAEASE